jgi:hypothetical protein
VAYAENADAEAYDDVAGEINQVPGPVTLKTDGGRLVATTLWVNGPTQERPAISLLDTCSQSDLVDKAFLEAAGPDITCRPAPGTVVLEGVAGVHFAFVG